FTTTGDDVGGWHRALMARPEVVSRLGELRGWTPEAIMRFGVGYDGERITIPVADCAGRLTGVGRYQPNPATRNGDRKMLQIGALSGICFHGRRRSTARKWF